MLRLGTLFTDTIILDTCRILEALRRPPNDSDLCVNSSYSKSPGQWAQVAFWPLARVSPPPHQCSWVLAEEVSPFLLWVRNAWKSPAFLISDIHIPLHSQKKYKQRFFRPVSSLVTSRHALPTRLNTYLVCVWICFWCSSCRETWQHLVYFMDTKTGKGDSHPLHRLF